jgi:hypothetical protein
MYMWSYAVCYDQNCCVPDEFVLCLQLRGAVYLRGYGVVSLPKLFRALLGPVLVCPNGEALVIQAAK